MKTPYDVTQVKRPRPGSLQEKSVKDWEKAAWAEANGDPENQAEDAAMLRRSELRLRSYDRRRPSSMRTRMARLTRTGSRARPRRTQRRAPRSSGRSKDGDAGPSDPAPPRSPAYGRAGT